MINIPEFNVSDFNKLFKNVVESNFGYVRIRGEISELKTATKGQIYITLKDDKSILSGVIWESKKNYINFKPEIGMEVTVTGKITTWSRFKTTYQIDIDNLEIAGEGALLKLIQDRKKRLKEKGFFDQENKKEIPYLPSRVGIITSPSGSVIHDIINRLKVRFLLNADIWPVSVQGNGAVESLILAVKGFNNIDIMQKPDVIIIARGGGSTEDLMAFNDEELALEIFKSEIPIITAIGHETDTTIVDFVSDLRASTPTAAAEMVAPTKVQLIEKINNFESNLNQLLNNFFQKKLALLLNLSRLIKEPKFILNNFKEKYKNTYIRFSKEIKNILINKKLKFNSLSHLVKPPNNILKVKKERIHLLEKNMNNFIERKKNNTRLGFNSLTRLLNSNSVNNNLKKGYTILTKSKKIVKKSSEINLNDNLAVKFFDKTIRINVKKIN